MRKTREKVQGRYTGAGALPKGKLFPYGEGDLEHLTFAAFQDFVRREYAKVGPGVLLGQLKRYPILAKAFGKDPGLGPWLFFVLHVYDPDLQCNLRPHIVPGLAIASGSLEGAGKRRAGGQKARSRVLGFLQALRKMRKEDPAILGALMASLIQSGKSSWDAASFNATPIVWNEDRARQYEILLARRHRGRPLPKQINDIDAYVFAKIANGVLAALPDVETKKVLGEVARATGWSSGRRHRGRSPGSIEKKIGRTNVSGK